MTEVSQRWSFLDQASVAVHDLRCESLGPPLDPPGLELDPAQTDDAVLGYGLAARRIYDDLKRVIGQAGGLLILAQASTRREAFELPALAQAEDVCREACDRLRSLSAPARLMAHRERLEGAAHLVTATLAALREVPLAGAELDLSQASRALSRSYALLQSTSEIRFGMTMVDFRHACCTCGAMRQ